MKVTFDKQKLLAAITPAAGISQTKNTFTSVDGLLFECPPNPKFGDYDTDNPELCRISAFDLEKGLRTSVECKVYEKGMFVINTSKILQIVRALPDGEVTLEIDDRCRVSITCGFSHFEISATPGDDFPTMPMFIGERQYKIPQYKIKDIINATVFSVAQNDRRAAFNGALIKIKDGCMTAVGCDGDRLSAAKCDISDTNDTVPDAEIIIPGRFLTELSKLLRDSEDEVTMIIGRRNVIFKIDDIYFFTRIIDAEFINYEKLLPTSYMTEAYVSVREMQGAIERASIVSEDKLGGSGRVHVKLNFANNTVTMSSVSRGGSLLEKIPAAIDGAEITIGFDCRFLLDVMRACPSECERLRVRLNSPLMAVIIEPAEGSGFVHAKPDATVFGERELDVAPTEEKRESFMYLVMPIRMNN